MNKMMSTALEFFLITLVSLWDMGLQAPMQSQSSSNSVVLQDNGTYYTWMPITSCPGYDHGNPSRRNMTGCETGTSLGPVDHETAFQFSPGENPDWNNCGLPYLPEEK